MRFSMRPYLMAGVGIVAAGSIAIPPSVAPPGHPARHESVTLAAHIKPVNPLVQQVPGYATAQAAAALLPPEALTSTAALTETLDAASAQVSALALPGLGNAIIAAYDVVMPWVDWAVNLGIYATQWIPGVNWFTPQISIVYYALIEPIITSAVFNTAYWVGGAISLGQGLANFFNDTVNAGIGFVNAEIDWFLSFLPPLPPFIPLAAQATMEVVGARTAMQVAAPADLDEPDAGATGTEAEKPESGEQTAPLPDEIEPTDPEATEQTPVDVPQDEDTSDPDPTDDLDGVEDDIDSDIPAEDITDADLTDDDIDKDDLGSAKDLDEPAAKDEADKDSDATSDNGPDSTPETKSAPGSDSRADTPSESTPGAGADGKASSTE